MPIYEFKCVVCDQEQTAYRSLKEFDNVPVHCGNQMIRVIGAPAVIPDIEPFRSPIDGSIITSRNKKNAMVRDHKLLEVGNDYDQLQRECAKKLEEKHKQSKQEIVEELRARVYS